MGGSITCLSVANTVEIGVELDGLQANLGCLALIIGGLHFVRRQNHVTIGGKSESAINLPVNQCPALPKPRTHLNAIHYSVTLN